MEKAKNLAYKLLKKSEKYTKTDMIYLAKGGFWINMNFIFTSLTSFVLSVIFAHLVPKETYGIYQYVMATAAIITAFSLTGINTAVTQAVARGYEGVLEESIPVQFKWSFISTLVSLAFSLYYLLNGAYVFSICFVFVAILMPITNTMNTWNAYFVGKKDFKKIFSLNNKFNFFYLLVMGATAYAIKSPVFLVLSYFLASAIANTVIYFHTIKTSNPNKNIDHETFSYSKHLSAINILGTVASKIDSILIFHFLGAADLAVYTFAKIIPEKIGGLFKSIMGMAMPKLAEKSMAEIRKDITSQMLKLLSIGILLATIFAFIAPFFYKVFFPKYVSSVFYAQIYAFSMIVLATQLPSVALLSQKATKRLYYLSIINPTFQLCLLFILVGRYGILGAIGAKLLSQFFNLFSYWASVKFRKTS